MVWKSLGRFFSSLAILFFSTIGISLGLSVVVSSTPAGAADGNMTMTVVTPTSNANFSVPIQGIITGTVTVSWGDGTPDSTTTTNQDIPHTYVTAGSHTVTIS